MKILQRGLKKEEIALSRGYMRWYKIVNNSEIRLFINEDKRQEDGSLANVIDWKNDVADLCIGSNEYNKKFYNDNKYLKVRLFVKSDNKSLYNELEVKGWSLEENSIRVDL